VTVINLEPLINQVAAMVSFRMSSWCISLVVLLYVTAVSWAFHTGAPEVACGDMTPQHGVSPQTDRSPYRIIMQKKQVSPGETVDILLTAPTAGPPFKGFFIQVHPRNGDKPVGEFSPDSDENAQPVNCDGKTNSAMTHKDLNPKVKVTLKWTPPGEGEYVPIVTWVKQQDTIWVREMPDDGTIKVSGNGLPSGGAAEGGGSKQEEGKSAETNNTGDTSSAETPGQNLAVTLLNNSVTTWTAVMIALFSGTLFMHRQF